jgi:PAB-dependent poly(A)-specific ribonuclease subunit 2
VAAFYGPELQRYVSVKAHIGEGPVRQFLFHERGVLSIARNSVHLTSRRGLTQWHLIHPNMVDLRCMTFTSNSSQILVAGCQSAMLVIDVDKGQVMSQLPSEASYTMMKRSRYICAATESGAINVLDTTDFKVLKSWKAHVTAINDMDVRGDFLVTCGFSVRHLGTPIVDPLANVYDLKSLNSLPPLPFHAGAAYVRLHPKLQTTSFVASQTGQMQVVDLMNPNSVNLRQANVQFMLGMELAPSGDALAIVDAEGSIHLWGSRSKVRFSKLRQETEFPDSQPDRPPFVDWRDMPLNAIGMPYYHERLLSAWPSHMVFDIGAPPPQIDPNLVLQPAEMGFYAPNPKQTARYQVEDTRASQLGSTITAPKFLSEKAKEIPNTNLARRRMSDAAEALAGATLASPSDEDPMMKYSNVEIKYSRFGVDDFDFRYYNKTSFSGLETHIANSFTNAILQLYRFVPLIRNLALHHAATSCIAENCLLCELGFLTDMLEKAAGQNCQATNLLHAFSASREAVSLGLLEQSTLASGVSLSSTIQSVNRFLLKQIGQDFRSLTGTSDDVDAVIATGALELIRCMYCGNEITRPGTSYVNELVYPPHPPNDLKNVLRNPIFRFSAILKASIERESKNRGWCNKCRRYQQLSIRKSVQHLPFVMMINAALTNPTMRSLWETPDWLPTEVGILVQNRNVYCFEGADLGLHIRNKTPNLVVYELVGFVAEIDVAEHQRPHLVSFINVDISSPQSSSGQATRTANWHLFNDFLVAPVTEKEALLFNQGFKLPCILSYQIKSAHGAIDQSWKENLDTVLLFHQYSINGGHPAEDCHILGPTEKPTQGTPIALDTEFVDLERAEIDVKADGTQETIRPAKSGLARVSVLRGAGEAEGVPFIDDYITIKDTTIVDYKTQYSGIRPGDLDPRTSSHNLVPLKVAYKKLWLLLNLGCIFVGHGLASDFRKINIQVPKNQTVDTQYLYLVPGKNRRFSLRYLAWAVFKEFIQEESLDETTIDGHDSIEDARMALRLWRKFQEWQDAGIVDQMVEEIYKKGFRYQWRPPARDGSFTGATSAVPSGRNTPEVGGISAPSTPAKGFRLSAASVATFAPRSAAGRSEDFGGSPLR